MLIKSSATSTTALQTVFFPHPYFQCCICISFSKDGRRRCEGKTNTFHINTLDFKEACAEDTSWLLSERAMDTPILPIIGLQSLLLST